MTAVHSPNEFEIDDYRITKDATVTLELEKSEDPDEKATFNPDEIRVGTEMEIRGELDQTTNQLTARTIKINLDEHQRVKRTALLEVAPNLKQVGNVWEGQIHVDGQRVLINESTVITVKPNNTQKKATKEAAKVVKKRPASPKDSESDLEMRNRESLSIDLTRILVQREMEGERIPLV